MSALSLRATGSHLPVQPQGAAKVWADLRSGQEILADVARADLRSMPAQDLLAVATAAGLAVTAEGGRLVMRGPRRAEELISYLLSRKAEVLAALAALATDPPPVADPVPPAAQAPGPAGRGPGPATGTAQLAVPAGAEVFMVDADARPCTRERCHLWTWSGAARWFYATDVPPPERTLGGAPKERVFRRYGCTP